MRRWLERVEFAGETGLIFRMMPRMKKFPLFPASRTLSVGRKNILYFQKTRKFPNVLA
jgi:hypothetical protein